MAVLDRRELEESPLSDLHAIASELGIEGYRLLRREALIDQILGGASDGGASDSADAPADDEERPRRRRARGGRGRRRGGDEDDAGDEEARDAAAADEGAAAREELADEPEEVRAGILDILPNGSGFMRAEPFVHSKDDVYVSPAQVRRLELRAGDEIEGPVRPPRRNERHPSLVRIDKVNGASPDAGDGRKRFDDLTPVFATARLPAPEGLDGVPFGRGSRVAIGGPPGAGITTLLRRIVETLAGDDALEVIVVLAGARPEEVTEWRRDAKVHVAGGAFDRPVEEQAQAAEMAVERGKRAVEQGRHAALVIDSLDALPPSVARRVFGAARATEEGGTLTIFASTGLAGEPMRFATTRVVLEHGGELAAGSGTLHAERLS